MISSVSTRFLPISRQIAHLSVFAGVLVLAVALVAAGALKLDHAGTSPWVAVALLGVVAAVAEKQSVYIGSNVQTSVTVLPIVFAAVTFGPLAAMFVGAASLLVDFRAPYLRWLIWTASRTFGAGAAGIAAALITETRDGFTVLVTAVAVAAAVEAFSDTVLTATTLWIRRTGGFRGTVRTLMPLQAAALPLYVPVIAVLAYAYDQLSAWTVLLFFVPALAAQRLYLLYQRERDLSTQLSAANTRLEEANLSFATALVATLDARDRYTAGHSAAVAVYSRDIAARMGLSDEHQQLAHVAGLVHDIGKIGLPAGLLEKPGPLTLEERRIMERHAQIGERILANVPDYREIAAIVRHHHERVDGRGYPDRLEGDHIPLISRIIAVADAYNAMTSDRPYRDAMPSRVARLRLAQAVESQFDTSVVAAFEAILASSAEEYRIGTSAEFGAIASGLAGDPPTLAANAA
jgi:putative nucleotidyltransferase with HDIG domain